MCVRCGVQFVPAEALARWECRVHPGHYDGARGHWTCCGLPTLDASVYLGGYAVDGAHSRGCTRADHTAQWELPPARVDAALELLVGMADPRVAHRMGATLVGRTRADVERFVAPLLPPGTPPDATVDGLLRSLWRRALSLATASRPVVPAFFRALASEQGADLCGAETVAAMDTQPVRTRFVAFLAEFRRPVPGALGRAGLETPLDRLMARPAGTTFYELLEAAVSWLYARATDITESHTIIGRTFLPRWEDELVPSLMAAVSAARHDRRLPVLPFARLETRDARPQPSVVAAGKALRRRLDGRTAAHLGESAIPDASPGPEPLVVDYLDHFAGRRFHF